MKAKKFLAIALTLTMLLVLCVVGANAEADVLPDGAALVDAEHNGFYVKENDYYITSLDGLKYFRDTVNQRIGFATGANPYSGKTVHLMTDIDLENDPWEPIGYKTSYIAGVVDKSTFYGNFNGHNHTISNLYFHSKDDYTGVSAGTEEKAYYTGLFGYVISGTTFQDLTIKNVNLSAEYNVGALMGAFGTGNLGTISNVNVTGTIKLEGKAYVGGLYGIGYSNVQNCTLGEGQGSFTVTGREDSYAIGGLIGAQRDNINKSAAVSGNTLWNPIVTATEEFDDLVGNNAMETASSEPPAYTTYTNNVVKKPAAQIGDTKYYSLKDAFKAAVADDTIQVFDGTYQFNYNDVIIYNNLTVQGNADDLSAVVLKNDGAAWKAITANGRNTPGINVTFKNLTVDAGGKSAFVSQFANLTVENVIIKNANRAFEVSAAESLTTGGYPAANGKTATITAKNVRTENTVTTTVKVETLPDTGARSATAVSTAIFDYDDTCVFEGGLTTLVHNGVDGLRGYENHLIKKNGELEEDLLPIAKIGDKFYGTLAKAIAAAEPGETVTLLDDVTLSTAITMDGVTKYGAVINKSITLDGNGKTITSGTNRTIGIMGDSADSKIDVTIKNLTINNAQSGGGAIFTRGNLNSLTLDTVNLMMTGDGYTQPLTISGNAKDNIANVTITNSVFESHPNCQNGYAIINWVPANFTITDSTVKGWACLYAKTGTNGTTYTVDGCKLISANQNAGDWNSFGLIALESKNVKAFITNTEIDISGNKNTQALASFSAYYAPDNDVSECVVSLGVGNNVKMLNDAPFATNEKSAYIKGGTLTITGGTFDKDPSSYVADGYIANKVADNKWIVTEKAVLDTTAETLEVKDDVTGVEVEIDTSAGSAMKEIFDKAAEEESVTVVESGSNTVTTTKEVDLAIVIEEKSDDVPNGGFAVIVNNVNVNTYEKEKVAAVFDISVQKTTTTTTTTKVTETDAFVSETVQSQTTTESYEGGSTKVTFPYDKTGDPENTVYSIVYYKPATSTEDAITEVMDATYDSENKCFVFYTTHFSTYFIYAETFNEGDITTNFEVVLKPVSEGANVNEYQIILKTNDDKVINRFTSADLTFALTGTDGHIVYRDGITANSAEYIKLNDSQRSADRFEFYVNGNDGTKDISDITGKSIVLGTITFGGYGTGWNFEITKAVINTTEFSNNIVVTTTNEAGVTLNTATSTKFTAPTAKINPLTINPETKRLTVDVTFPNAVSDNVSAYQDMEVTVSGGDLSQPIVVSLGNTAKLDKDTNPYVNVTAGVVPGSYPYSAGAKVTSAWTDKYIVVIDEILSANVMYTVEVSGAGYRTARYNVLMTGDKTLTFWNNVMDAANATVIETGSTSAAVVKNFLAGDIVKDEQINIYDLSAVVSYFGTENTVTDHPEYAKYDLNRDGKIDSIDVAYVLVSWNN